MKSPLEGKRKIWDKIICKIDFTALAYNGFFAWEKIDDGLYGLSLKGVIIGLFISCKKLIFNN